MVDGYWRVSSYDFSPETAMNVMQAHAWCRQMNQQTKIATTFGLLGIDYVRS